MATARSSQLIVAASSGAPRTSSPDSAHSASSSASAPSSSAGALSSSSEASVCSLDDSSTTGDSRFWPRSKKRRNGMSGKRARPVAESSAAGTLEIAEDLDAHCANEREFARVGRGAVQQRAHGAHDELDVARLEELDRGQAAFDIDVGALELFRGGWGRQLLRGSDPTRRVSSGEVQLVQTEERGLREIQRSVLSRWNHHCRVHAIENVVWQAAVLAAKDHCDRTIGSRLE